MLWQDPSAQDGAPLEAQRQQPRWTHNEHSAFIKALEEFGTGSAGNEWELIARAVGGKTENDVKMHARQYFLKLERERQIPAENMVQDSNGIAGKQIIIPDDIDNPGGGGNVWTAEEARAFEEKLALVDKDAEDRWRQIAATIPTKTEAEVEAYYRWLQHLLRSRGAGQMGVAGLDGRAVSSVSVFHNIHCDA